MMRKAYFLPCLALIGGAAGFCLRRWELATAFETDTHLPLQGAPATWTLLILSLLMAGALLLLCTGARRPFPGGYGEAFGSSRPSYAAAATAAGFLIGAGGILKLAEFPAALQEAYGLQPDFRAFLSVLPKLLLALLCLASAACVVWSARNNYRHSGGGARSVLLLVPAFTCCIWLIAAYQERAADPVLRDYIYQLFAIIFILLAFYDIAGCSFEKVRVARTAFFSLFGVYLSCVALADAPDLGTLLLYAFAVLYLTVSAAVLLGNDSRLIQAQKDQQSPEGGTL